MFCQSCGTQMLDAAACANCGTSGTPSQSAAEFRGKATQASKDALVVAKDLATNPIGGLATAYVELGAARALGVGITFALIFATCWFLGAYLTLSAWAGSLDLGSMVKIWLFSLVPFISIASASALARKVFSGAGSLGGDSFIAGVSLLPLGILAFLSGLLGWGNFEFIGFLGIFALCLTLLMLYAGCTRISQLSEPQATIAVPLMILISAWFTKVLFTALLT